MNSYELQQLLMRPDSQGRITLPSGEFEGPFKIDKPCTVVGNSTTLWRGKGPILTVSCAGVRLENLRIEITNDNLPAAENIAVYSAAHDTVFKDVEIIGRIVGIDGEDDPWGIPKMIALGTFPAERDCYWTMQLAVPVEAELISIFHDISVSPEHLQKGLNTVTISAASIKKGSYIYGELLLRSAVTRRIYLCGSADETVTDYTDGVSVYKADTEALEAQEKAFEEEVIYPDIQTPPPEKNEMYKPEISELDEDSSDNNYEINRGMHIPISCPRLQLELMYDNLDFPMDIDVFAFLADKKGNVTKNDRFVFFGNDHSLCGTVRYLNAPDKKVMYVDLGKAPFDIAQIDFAYSIYENPLKLDFSSLKNPRLTITLSDGKVLSYKLLRPLAENTLVGAELKFTGSRWELTPLGMIYPRGLADLCGNYSLRITK